MNSAHTQFHLRDWPRVPKRQRQALAVLLLCVAFFLASGGTVVALLIREAREQAALFPVQAVARPISAPAEEPEETLFSDGELPPGTDAGEAYLADTLWLGDSNTVRMYVYGLVPLENYMAQEGMGIEGVTGVPCVRFEGDARGYTIAEAVALVRPRRVVMTFGTNNAGGKFTCEEFISLYADAVDALQQAAPDCDIIVNAIPPVGEVRSYPDVTMDRIDEFNDALEAFCQKRHLPFLNSAQALKGKNGFAKPAYVIEDGLHMSEAGLELLMQYLREHPLATRRQSVAHSGAPQRSPPDFS